MIRDVRGVGVGGGKECEREEDWEVIRDVRGRSGSGRW